MRGERKGSVIIFVCLVDCGLFGSLLISLSCEDGGDEATSLWAWRSLLSLTPRVHPSTGGKAEGWASTGAKKTALMAQLHVGLS